jgi:hypothetical protein
MYHDLLRQARTWGEHHYPQASSYKHAAFANGVLYVLHRASGGFGGPSVREHAVAQAVNDTGRSFTDFETACQFVAPIVYGPLTDLHRRIWDDQQVICHDNDPEDERQLKLYRAN